MLDHFKLKKRVQNNLKETKKNNFEGRLFEGKPIFEETLLSLGHVFQLVTRNGRSKVTQSRVTRSRVLEQK